LPAAGSKRFFLERENQRTPSIEFVPAERHRHRTDKAFLLSSFRRKRILPA